MIHYSDEKDDWEIIKSVEDSLSSSLPLPSIASNFAATAPPPPGL